MVSLVTRFQLAVNTERREPSGASRRVIYRICYHGQFIRVYIVGGRTREWHSGGLRSNRRKTLAAL
jgi:hypothetical protein